MSDKRYLGNIITPTPTAPSGRYQDSAAPGVWSLAEALEYTKAGLWPSLANGPAPIAYYSRQDNTNTSGYIYYYYNVSTAVSADGYTARCYGGRTATSSSYHVVVQCFNAQGELTFWKYDGFNSRYDATQPYDVCVDDNYVYLVYGYFEFPQTSATDRVYMTCFDRDTGTVQWNVKYDDLRVNANGAVGHRLDNGASGELVMAGKFTRASADGGFIARINKTNGAVIASKRTSDQYAQPTESHGIRYLDGTIFFNIGYGDWSVNNALTTVNACSTQGTDVVGFDAGPNLTARLTTNELIVMDHSFTRQWGVSMSSLTPRDVFVDDDDNVYAAYNDSGEVTKWDSSGNIVWQRSLGGGSVTARPVGSRVREGMFTMHRPTSNSLSQGIVKLKTDGSGVGTYGDFTYSSTTRAFSSSGTTPSPTAGTLNNDIGSASAGTVTWYDQGGTNTETVYIIP